MEAVHSIDPQDEQHLDQLVIGHYVVGGITCLFGCLPLLHVTIGLFVVTASGRGGATPPALFAGSSSPWAPWPSCSRSRWASR